MDSKEIRQKFLDFFRKKGHKIVPSSSLIPTDPSVLFTTAGMQQFKEYFLGKESPYGKRVTSCQKCFRTSDIEIVGDISHLTFVEMLGNFSFGDYFKKETIEWAYEFITKELDLKIDYVSVFAGDSSTSSGQVVPADTESEKIWLNLGIPAAKIKKMGREDNFWGPTGLEGPCGPTTEIYINNIEVWNLVFNEYYQDRDGKLTPLKQKGVDTGMGLERLMTAVQKKDSVFETDLFEPIIKEIGCNSSISYNLNPKLYRIIADHIRSSIFLISEDIFPSNIERGSALRRIIRNALDSGRILHLPENFLIALVQRVMVMYKDIYPEVGLKYTDTVAVIQKEEDDYRKSESEREKIAQKLILKRQEQGSVTGAVAYDIFSTTRIGMDRIEELAKELDIEFTDPEMFFSRAREFQEISRAGVEKKFGGVGKDAGLIQAKYHTATHLLHAALREILGLNVKQMGSDITSQRLRFDFSHPQKLTPEEIKKVEYLVNQKIKEDLKVKKEEMSLDEALKSGALAFAFFSARGGSAEAFGVGGKEKYPEKVSVFSIGNLSNSSGQVFSKEICAGPHANKTSELGKFKIIKEESSGAGIRRIRGILIMPAQ